MEKIKVHIYTDKAYPVYYMAIANEFYVDVTEVNSDLYQKYLAAKKTWDEVQAELKAIY